ncbi:hypothetical protein [Paraburkholderia tropica]|uniref:hypothetical protein n=2 Tax=Paraburkholderia tropica TaxID=92647 RepID=UPI001619F170|nr:hypothetical protein [Paraburkholderia tropica]MBB2981726.1 hypothetical protein [Paraburkholderia tropica]
MPSHPHYFVLDERNEPVETSFDEWARWATAHGTTRKTSVGAHARVRTYFQGLTDDVTMPEPPHFVHHVEGPGLHGKSATSPTYEEAIARHERIVTWLRDRVARTGEVLR